MVATLPRHAGRRALSVVALPEMAGPVVYIAITGFGQPEDFRRTAQAGFARHLVKPVDPGELDKLLRRALSVNRP